MPVAQHDSVPEPRRLTCLLLAGLLVICVGLRIGIVSRYWEDLSDDRDAYLNIAQSLQTGGGYSTLGSDVPTAFRPPLYPLVITPFAQPEQRLGRAALNVIFAAITLLAIWYTGRNLGLSVVARVGASILFCLDPLLLRYTAYPMTETLCTCLTAMLLWRLTRPESGIRDGFVTGVVFGLCVLCRPTIWAFGGLYALYWVLFLRNSSTGAGASQKKVLLATMTGVLCFVLPWTLRNWVQLGSPVVMTTHGGYTILLGNNERFYEEVVQQPWGTVWDGSVGGGQVAWVTDLNQQMAELNLKSEVERDHWMSNLARKTISENPGLFIKASILRVVRFWNIMPTGPAQEAVNSQIVIGVSLYYSLLWVILLVGIAKVLPSRRLRDRYAPLLLLIIALTCVHAVYWSNARMRAPAMPAIVLLAALAFDRSKPKS